MRSQFERGRENFGLSTRILVKVLLCRTYLTFKAPITTASEKISLHNSCKLWTIHTKCQDLFSFKNRMLFATNFAWHFNIRVNMLGINFRNP